MRTKLSKHVVGTDIKRHRFPNTGLTRGYLGLLHARGSTALGSGVSLSSANCEARAIAELFREEFFTASAAAQVIEYAHLPHSITESATCGGYGLALRGSIFDGGGRDASAFDGGFRARSGVRRNGHCGRHAFDRDRCTSVASSQDVSPAHAGAVGPLQRSDGLSARNAAGSRAADEAREGAAGLHAHSSVLAVNGGERAGRGDAAA